MKLTIRGLTGEMEGVASLEDGMTVFVNGALPGEVVEARIVKKEKRFARAEIVEILCPSGERRAPFCPHFGTCGGCAGQHMEYGATLTAKRQGVQDALRRIGGADNGVVRQFHAFNSGLVELDGIFVVCSRV